MAGTFTSVLFGDPQHMFGGSVLRIAALCGSGAVLVWAGILLVLQRRYRAGRP